MEAVLATCRMPKSSDIRQQDGHLNHGADSGAPRGAPMTYARAVERSQVAAAAAATAPKSTDNRLAGSPNATPDRVRVDLAPVEALQKFQGPL